MPPLLDSGQAGVQMPRRVPQRDPPGLPPASLPRPGSLGEVLPPTSPKASVVPALVPLDKMIPFLEGNLKAKGS